MPIMSKTKLLISLRIRMLNLWVFKYHYKRYKRYNDKEDVAVPMQIYSKRVAGK